MKNTNTVCKMFFPKAAKDEKIVNVSFMSSKNLVQKELAEI